MLDPARLHVLNDRPPRDGAYVLYWMIGSRRTRHNPALEQAIAHSAALGVPLVVFEPLRAGYDWASDRHHRFVMDGMEDNAAACAAANVRYVSWLEPKPGAGKGLLEALAADAAVVVTDLTPVFFLHRMVTAAAAKLGDVRFEAVDGVGVMPLASSDREYTTASSFRRHLQKHLLPHLHQPSAAEPLKAYDGELAPVPAPFEDYPGATELAELPIDHDVKPCERGGPVAGEKLVQRALDDRLPRYADDRNHPDAHGATGLSPFLHFGHVSAEDVVHRVFAASGWTLPDEAPKATGSRGWWGLPEGPEAFMDELVTWRELAQAFAWHRDDHDQLSSIPDWAQQTLADHAGDDRALVSLEKLEAARSPDPLWNAAQRELVRTGRMHNYLRMLWGKCVLAWAPSPETAFRWLLHLNNKYALDGRDPNSTAGVAWVFGRHDRAWGPEREIYGKVRYMTSDSTRKKLQLESYLARFGK